MALGLPSVFVHVRPRSAPADIAGVDEVLRSSAFAAEALSEHGFAIPGLLSNRSMNLDDDVIGDGRAVTSSLACQAC